MRYKWLVLLLGFMIFLNGCAWFSEGLLNVFDPKAQIRVSNFTISPPAEEGAPPTIAIDLLSLNQVGARFGTFIYKFSKDVGGITTQEIPELTKTYSINVLLPPGTEEGGGTVTISNVPLYFDEITDYVNNHPEITELLLTLWLKGVDEANHKLEINILRDYPLAVSPPKVEAINIIAEPSTLAPGEKATVTIKAYTKTGKPVNGAIITLVATGGTLSASSVITNSSGEATVTFTAGNTPGEATITATSGDTSANTTLIITAPQPASINLIATPSSVSAGGKVVIGVQVLDASGNPIEGATVTLAASAGTLEASSLTTDATGSASTTLDTTGTTEDITITALSGGVTATTTVTITP